MSICRFSQEHHNKPIISRMIYTVTFSLSLNWTTKISAGKWVIPFTFSQTTFVTIQSKVVYPSCSRRANQLWEALWCQCSRCPFLKRQNIKTHHQSAKKNKTSLLCLCFGHLFPSITPPLCFFLQWGPPSFSVELVWPAVSPASPPSKCHF